MARLIDASDVYSLFDKSGFARLHVADIDKIPRVDAVPVVRCRECKWWHEDDDVGHCDNPDGLDNYANPEDFCSYGERKDGNGNG